MNRGLGAQAPIHRGTTNKEGPIMLAAAPPPGDPGPPADGPPDSGPPPVARLRLAAYFLRYLKPHRGLLALVLLATALGPVLALPMSFLPLVLTAHWDDTPYLVRYFAFVL